jgi:hypothetical protein
VSVAPHEPDHEQPAARASVRDSLPPWHDAYNTEDLVEMLRQVPEVSPGGRPASDGAGTRDDAQEKEAWQSLVHKVQDQRDKFLDGLVAKRLDLAGLPFRKDKDCQLGPEPARALDKSSQEVRRRFARFLGPADPHRTPDPESPGSPAAATLAVYYQLLLEPHWRNPASAPALEQILTGAPAPVRLGLVQYFRFPADSPDGAVLARRAVFDPSAEVRREAVVGLSYRPAGEYLPVLLSGLRYPWPPANYHAAEALVALGAGEAVPDLVRVLAEPDPCAPFEVEEGSRRVPAVRELVRLNHHGSCLLCHAPSFERDDPVRAPVPSPLEPLPPPTRMYYGGGRAGAGNLFVRADVTYLRQDFSEVLPVKNPGPWPDRQRFDFLVRVRQLTADEARAWRGRGPLADSLPVPASRQAAAYALRQMTGLEGGFTAESWDAALARAWRQAGPD